ncbi:PqqD family protein [Gammaproteobacteria bacterium]|nr:PqqD family protein [Gammaproteobacteria bacterium]
MKPRPDLAIENVDGELIVLDKAAGKVHQLNSSASFVWGCLSDGLAIDEIALMLSEAFDVEPETALSDVKAALAQFKGLALVIE